MNQVNRHLFDADANSHYRLGCPAIVLEYCKLASQKHLCEADADRMHEILELAELDGLLDFWINEADHFLAHELNLTSETSIHNFENQQAKLREYLEHKLAEDSVFELLEDLRQRVDLFSDISSKNLQQHLKKRGFDPGPIDGVLGPRTHSALAAFQEANELIPTGVPDSLTRQALGLY